MEDLKTQVQTLREALSEAVELNKKSTEVLDRALKGEPTEKKAEAEPPRPRKRPAPVRARPREEARERVSAGTVRGKVNVPSGEPIAYVYVENVFAPPVRKEVSIDQKNKRFIPSWAVIRRGTTVAFPNSDNIYHNVFSLSSGNSFDLGLYNASAEAKKHTFNSPGAVDVYCNIHPQMAASVLVVPNQLFARVKADGTFAISDVPPGQRKIVAWAPGSKLRTQWVEVGEGVADVELTLEPKSRSHKNKRGQAYGSYE
jgi:plastocyanin